jgi:hypothetical protein
MGEQRFLAMNSRSSRPAAPALRQAVALALVLGLQGAAQNVPSAGSRQMQQPIGQSVGHQLDDFGGPNTVDEERRLRMINADRQKTMISDTAKLLKLANELKDEVDKTNPDALSPIDERKLAEIEKLAHTIKDKMSYSMQVTPPFHNADQIRF